MRDASGPADPRGREIWTLVALDLLGFGIVLPLIRGMAED